MDNINNQEIQVLVQELQLARNQIQTVSTQINEITLTLESLSKQDEVFNSKKFNFFVKSQEVRHSLCIVFNLL